jgi:flavin-dependent dehydrogenase
MVGLGMKGAGCPLCCKNRCRLPYRIFERDAMTTILIRGEGVAGLCCARLLGQSELEVCLERSDRPRVPAIMIGETTQRLLRDVFGAADLFDGLAPIRRRIVLWGGRTESVVLPHSAIVVSEEVLLDCIRQRLNAGGSYSMEDPEWTIIASLPLRPSSTVHQFGARMAAASKVRLSPQADREACWVESLESGWLFLLPDSEEYGWLLTVGEEPDRALAGSRLVQAQLLDGGSLRGTFPCHPRIVQPLAEAGWIACGTAALGFDPLCGDGIGNAVREAILGSAVIRVAATQPASVDHLVTHYRARLLAGFKRHLQLCLDFYQGGHSGPWWEDQLRELRRGLQWCAQTDANMGEFRYRLSGFALEPAD